MSTTKFRFYCFLIAVLLSPAFSYGQNSNCSEVLIKAQDTYKEGRINEIADMLQPCLETGLSKQEKIEAYRLLTLTYLYFNEKEKAQNALTLLLKNDPEYKIRQIDPTEFVNLFNSFRTTPVILIGAKLGVNYSDINVTKYFSLDQSDIARGKYKSDLGIQGSLFTQIPLSKRLSILTELQYTSKGYTYTDKLFGYASLTLSEKQTYLEVPVLVNYNFGKGILVPYVNLGGSFAYMFKSTVVPVRVDETGDNNQREIKEGEISVNSLRKKLNYNLMAGAGLKIKDVLGRGYLFFDLRYSMGLNNIVNPDKRYSNDDLVYKYLYVDNNIKINSFQYSIGYSYPLYKPKLKKVRKKDKILPDEGK
jgi:hypothetical protein